LLLNGREVKQRAVHHSIEAQLTTEIYNAESHSWQKPRRKSSIELAGTRDEEEPLIYEMGIPGDGYSCRAGRMDGAISRQHLAARAHETPTPTR